jgi:catalase
MMQLLRSVNNLVKLWWCLSTYSPFITAGCLEHDGPDDLPANIQTVRQAPGVQVVDKPTAPRKDGQGTDQKASHKDALAKSGELHQVADGSSPALTTQQGVPIFDNQNSLKSGVRGPTLLEDFILRDKLFHFDHERIPERVVHARGYGAHGYFETYEALADLTRADLFQRAGEKTKVFVRFSTVAGSKGSPDLARDVRGFAVKFYTQEGNWDIVGNNIPVFFIQDAMKFPDLVHAAKPEPDRGFPQAQTAHDNFWDFVSLTPESMHMIMWIMSDRTIPRSFRFIEGFGVHSFRLVNAAGKSTYVKFHWKPKLGLQSVTWNEAVKINGADPDFHRRDLWNAIESGNFPEWELGVQLFDDAFADQFEFDVLDATKIIPEELIPVRKIGRLVLDRNVDNFFAETEQVAFCTQNIVPGIDFTNDPLLQGRNFSYLDTQLKRLGSPNFAKLPINAAVCPIHNFQQDGHMATGNPKGRVNYEPNSWGKGPRETPRGFQSFSSNVEGSKQRQRSEKFRDHYSQARQFYISQTDVEQRHIVDALVFELSKVERVDIRVRMVSHLVNIDAGLAEDVAKGLGIAAVPQAATTLQKPNTKLEASSALSILKNGPKSFAGRTIGVLVSDGSDASIVSGLFTAIQKEKATMRVIGPRVGDVVLSNGQKLLVHEKIDGAPSVLYDAIAILASQESIEALKDTPAWSSFFKDALAHGKYIAFASSTPNLAKDIKAGGDLKTQLVELGNEAHIVGFIEKCRELRAWGADPKETAKRP